MKTNKLYAIKRVTFGSKTKVELKFLAPSPGEYELTLYCICDSYVGCDQVYKFYLVVLFNFFISKGEKMKITIGGTIEEPKEKENGK